MTTHIEKTERHNDRQRVLPRTDIIETEESVILVADVPGAGDDSIELTLTEDVLTLRGHPVEPVLEGWKPERTEFELPDYERTFRLATEIDRAGIQATIQNGSLRVTLPKKKPKTNRIEVRSG